MKKDSIKKPTTAETKTRSKTKPKIKAQAKPVPAVNAPQTSRRVAPRASSAVRAPAVAPVVVHYPAVVQLFGYEFTNETQSQLCTRLHKIITSRDAPSGTNASHTTTGSLPITVVTPNPEQIVQARTDRSFARALHQADIRVPDGVGLVWAAQALGVLLRGRLPGVDVVEALLEKVAPEVRTGAVRVMIVGGRGYLGETLQAGGELWRVNRASMYERVAAQPRTKDATKDSAWLPLYWSPGYAQASHPTETEERHLGEHIRLVRPQVIFVALGAPHQEEWLLRHRGEAARAGARLLMSVGGSFDYLLGMVPRAPEHVRHLGLEWLYRLARQPWRARRQVRLVQFMGMVGREVAAAAKQGKQVKKK